MGIHYESIAHLDLRTVSLGVYVSGIVEPTRLTPIGANIASLLNVLHELVIVGRIHCV